MSTFITNEHAENLNMADVTDYAVVHAMKHFGGGFVQTLAALCDRADPDNLARIKAAWPDYWAEYAEIARMKADKGEGPK